MTRTVLADKATAQAALGEATALHTSARAYLESALQTLWARVQAGHAPTLADRGPLWLAAAHAGRPIRAHGDRPAVHRRWRQRRLRDQPARPVPARRPHRPAAHLYPGDQLRGCRP